MRLIIMLVTLAALLSLYFFFVLVGAFVNFLLWLVVGVLAGWIASRITGSRQGVLGDIGIGLAGSVIGGVLYSLVTGHTAGGPLSLTRIGSAVLGAVLLLIVLKVLRGGGHSMTEVV